MEEGSWWSRLMGLASWDDALGTRFMFKEVAT